MKEIIEIYKNMKGKYVVSSKLYFDGVLTDDFTHIFDSVNEVIEFKKYYESRCWWFIEWVNKIDNKIEKYSESLAIF